MSSFESKIEHAILAPETTTEEVLSFCEKIVALGYTSVCVNLNYVKLVKTTFPTLNVVAVIDFPFGISDTFTKAKLIELASIKGASEVDVVMNMGLYKEKNYEEFTDELDMIVSVAHNFKLKIKIIVETCLWKDYDLKQLLKLCNEAGADYIKTSTGTHKLDIQENIIKRATRMYEIVDIWTSEIKKNNYRIKIKVSGGIKQVSQAKKLIEQGVDRIGTGSFLI
jgi:deoxyribose-phosphate aldolase